MINEGYLIIAIFLLGSNLFAQSKTDIIDNIIREIKSCENEQMEIKDVEFSDGGSVCKIKTAVPGQLMEKSIDLPLADVDIFSSTKIVKIGKDEYIYTYSLVASPRGRSGGLRKNMTRSMGAEVILPKMLNGQKIKRIESAFTSLTEMVTGQKKSFRSMPDSP